MFALSLKHPCNQLAFCIFSLSFYMNKPLLYQYSIRIFQIFICIEESCLYISFFFAGSGKKLQLALRSPSLAASLKSCKLSVTGKKFFWVMFHIVKIEFALICSNQIFIYSIKPTTLSTR